MRLSPLALCLMLPGLAALAAGAWTLAPQPESVPMSPKASQTTTTAAPPSTAGV